jgi:predicted metal-dependent hydrolase
MIDQLPPEFWRGVEEFNQQAFYECHDTLEALWIEAMEPEKRFYQGVLQIAVACHHLSNLNWRGAVMLLGEGIRRLENYTPDDYGVDVTGLVDQSTTLLVALQQAGIEKVEEFAYLFNDESQDKSNKSNLNLPSSDSPSLEILSLVDRVNLVNLINLPKIYSCSGKETFG